jgi:hypothetical protein
MVAAAVLYASLSGIETGIETVRTLPPLLIGLIAKIPGEQITLFAKSFVVGWALPTSV